MLTSRRTKDPEFVYLEEGRGLLLCLESKVNPLGVKGLPPTPVGLQSVRISSDLGEVLASCAPPEEPHGSPYGSVPPPVRPRRSQPRDDAGAARRGWKKHWLTRGIPDTNPPLVQAHPALVSRLCFQHLRLPLRPLPVARIRRTRDPWSTKFEDFLSETRGEPRTYPTRFADWVCWGGVN